MENFFANLWNGWTLIDVLIMVTLAYWMLYFRSQRNRKEEYLKIADIASKQAAENLAIEKSMVYSLQARIKEKQALIDRCTVRPRANGKFVKKESRPIIGYIANKDVFNHEGNRVFINSDQYPVVLGEKAPSCYGDDGKKYVIDTKDFSPVYSKN